MREVKKEDTSSRLKNLQYKLSVIDKSKNYLKKELLKIMNKELELKNKIRKEKEAISLVNRAKKLR